MSIDLSYRRSSHAVAYWLLCLVENELIQKQRDPLQLAYVGAGQIAWDNCCGMLVVAPEKIYRSVAFPNEAIGEEFCFEGQLTQDFVILLVRCVPTVDDRGRAPSQHDLNEAHKSLIEDAAVVWNAVTCADLPDDWQRANVSQTFVGADGGCIGVETRLTIGIPQVIWSI